MSKFKACRWIGQQFNVRRCRYNIAPTDTIQIPVRIFGNHLLDWPIELANPVSTADIEVNIQKVSLIVDIEHSSGVKRLECPFPELYDSHAKSSSSIFPTIWSR